MLVSVVVPCYHSEKTIEKLVDLVQEEFDRMPSYECEFVLVNDYSCDGTFEAIRRAAAKHDNVTGIDLAKNFGQHNAIMAGLNHVRGELVLGMDDDLQHYPDQIPLLLAKLEEGYDVVFGTYQQRQFSRWKNFTGAVSKFLLWRIVDRPKDVQMSSFWVGRRYVCDEICKFKGFNPYLQILFFRTTHNMANVWIEHHAREEGTSNYSFWKGMKLLMSSLNYTVIPLRISTFMGGLFSAAGFLGAVVVFVRKLLDPSIAVGWSSMMCAMLVLFGISFLMLGLVGEYVGKMILNLNATPQYVVRTVVTAGERPETEDSGEGKREP